MVTAPLAVSLFALVQAEFGADLALLHCTKATLVHLSHTLEDLVLRERIPALLFTGFQESSHWREETERYRALAAVAQQVCIFAGGPLPKESSAKELHITLAGSDPLRQEWFVLLLCPQFAVLLCGQDRQLATDDEAQRQFATLWSFDPPVIERVLDLLEQVVGSYRPDRLAALQQARAQYPLKAPDPALITRFTSELIRFEEQLHQRLLTTTRALEAQLRWRDDLLAMLVHDLRQPLQGISTALHLLDTAADGEAAPLRAIARHSTEQLQDHLQRLLDTSQLEAGQLRLQWQRLHPASLLELTLAPFVAQAQEAGIDLTTEVDGEVERLWADAALLQRVIQNLVGNALKFTTAGGQINVRVRRAPEGAALELRVRDTGIGMTPSQVAHVFERYYQGTDGDRRGSGLGLYFCRLVAEAHGGRIRADSQVGVGTAITLSLPLRPPTAALGQR
jgi:rsbT co-antagonist protein RsbR